MDVNLRSGPRKGADTIAALTAGTAIEIVACKAWCEVVANGKRGFVFRDAVNRGG